MLLLSRDDAYGALNKFVAAEITTTMRNPAMRIQEVKRAVAYALNWDELIDVNG